MDVRLLFPSLYLGAADLQGKDVTLTIRRVDVEELQMRDGSKQKKPVARFEETKARADKERQPDKEKRLVLNRTNAMTIAAMHGYEVDNWTGKRVTLFPQSVSAFGKTTDAIRIRPTVPASTPTPTAASNQPSHTTAPTSNQPSSAQQIKEPI